MEVATKLKQEAVSNKSKDENVNPIKEMTKHSKAFKRLYMNSPKRISPQTHLTTKEKKEQQELKECTFKPDIKISSKNIERPINSKLGDYLYGDAKKQRNCIESMKNIVFL